MNTSFPALHAAAVLACAASLAACGDPGTDAARQEAAYGTGAAQVRTPITQDTRPEAAADAAQQPAGTSAMGAGPAQR